MNLDLRKDRFQKKDLRWKSPLAETNKDAIAVVQQAKMGVWAKVKAVGNGQRTLRESEKLFGSEILHYGSLCQSDKAYECLLRIVFYKAYNKTIGLQRKPIILKYIIKIPTLHKSLI